VLTTWWRDGLAVDAKSRALDWALSHQEEVSGSRACTNFQLPSLAAQNLIKSKSK
jgi:hypothetical protein